MNKIVFIEDPENYLNMCAGCRFCELICSFQHSNMGNDKLSRIKLVSLEKGIKVPIMCQHCEDAPCAAACPSGALTRESKEQPVKVDEGRCIGCGTCVSVCPFGGININPITGVAFKCDLCGGDPHCVKYCPAQVLKFTSEQQHASLKRKKYARTIVDSEKNVELERNGG